MSETPIAPLTPEEHACADALRELVRRFELGEDELVKPDYPYRARGKECDKNSYLPCDTERVALAGFVIPASVLLGPSHRVTDGVLEDVFHDATEDATYQYGCFRKFVYKARPLPLCCERCDVECDSYASFTEHCTLFSHKCKMDSGTRKDPRFSDSRFQDPRHGDVYNALSTMAKFEAMSVYKQHMVAWFRSTCPTSSSGAPGAWANMVGHADDARDSLYERGYNSVGMDGKKVRMSKEEKHAARCLCTPERAAEVWLEDFVLGDFEDGLCGYALDVVKNGWEGLGFNGSTSERQFLSGLTGICHM
jgi:hypothetical protein